MSEYLVDSKQEINRADHLIYVSLKYTRTVDVIKSIIERDTLSILGITESDSNIQEETKEEVKEQKSKKSKKKD